MHGDSLHEFRAVDATVRAWNGLGGRGKQHQGGFGDHYVVKSEILVPKPRPPSVRKYNSHVRATENRSFFIAFYFVSLSTGGVFTSLPRFLGVKSGACSTIVCTPR